VKRTSVPLVSGDYRGDAVTHDYQILACVVLSLVATAAGLFVRGCFGGKP
jgi:hypothetical protein